MSGPLQGIRVIDLTSFILGPVATLQLADLGAEVIRIEPPEGDQFRYVGESRNDGMSAVFLTVNRNKKSVALDLKNAAAVEAVLRLCETADVFVHNMRADAVDRLGLGYDVVSRRKTGIIYAAGVGFGSAGTYGHKPAYDDVIQSLAGVAALAMESGDEPRYFPTVIADKLSGYMVSMAVSAALYRRAVSGEGDYIEIPMFETMVNFNLLDHFGGGAFVPASGPYGYTRMFSPYHRPLRTKDGFIAVIANTDRQWSQLFAALRQPLLSDDPRFSTITKRMENVIELYRIVEEELSSCTTSDWLATFEGLGIPCGRVNALSDLVDDPHLTAADFFKTHEHPTEGTVRTAAFPARFRQHPSEIRYLAPRLGEHTVSVLREVGYDHQAIVSLMGADGSSGE